MLLLLCSVPDVPVPKELHYMVTKSSSKQRFCGRNEQSLIPRLAMILSCVLPDGFQFELQFKIEEFKKSCADIVIVEPDEEGGDVSSVILVRSDTRSEVPKVVIELKKVVAPSYESINHHNLMESLKYAYYLIRDYDLAEITCCLTDGRGIWHVFCVQCTDVLHPGEEPASLYCTKYSVLNTKPDDVKGQFSFLKKLFAVVCK